ncbi:MAG: alpha/beta fold hydrolase [Labilithrix sp.]|nr:alpha/beta fold hydrolase [Labilithrix sp.]
MRGASARGRALVVALAFAAACSQDGALVASDRAGTAWAPCHETFECATIRVPVDYGAPDGETIPLALIRAPATDPEARLGAIVVNPGGPGVAMVDRLVSEYGVLRLAFARVFERFDVVAFDWRGVGRSAPLRCVGDAFLDEVRSAGLGLATPADVAETERLAKALAAGCRASAGDAMLEGLHTENAARDLDRVREALGEPKLDYLGLSYGTWLGATYATLFPERVGAFVLDTPVFSSPTDNAGRIERRAAAHDAALERFFTACGDDASCAFHGGAGARAVAAAFDALFSGGGGARSDAGVALTAVDAALAVTGALRADDRDAFAVDLAAAEAGDATALRARADVAAGKRADGTYDGAIEALVAIGALDLPFAEGTTASDLGARLAALGSRSALAASIPWALAIDWPWRRRAPAAPISAPSAAPILVVATRHDPVTPYEDAALLVKALANGSHLLTYEGGGHVALFRSDCVRGIVADYFLDPSRPPSSATCTR